MSNPVFPSSSDWPEKLATVLKGDFSPADHNILNDQDCLGAFHRALLQRNQQAKEEFQSQLSTLVLAWLRLHPRGEEAHHCQKEEYYVEQAFASFWQAIALHKKEEFSTLAAVLKYLKTSLNGVIIDTLRAYSRSKDTSIAGSNHPGEPVSADYDDGQETWENMRSLLSDEREQRLAYLLFHCGLQPREIAQAYPQEFGDVMEIVQVRRSIIAKTISTPPGRPQGIALEQGP